MNKSQLCQQVNAIEWFHSISLGHDIVTPGKANLQQLQTTFANLKLPDLNGKTLLDIGAWNGYYTFEAEKLGAEVTALDSFCWNGRYGTQPNNNCYDKSGFNLAHQVLNSNAKSIEMEVCDMCPKQIGKYDIVLFLGVLYHMKHPLLALEKVFSVTNELVLIETHVNLHHVDKPSMTFYPNAELNHDDTNWWGPNTAAVLAMMKTVGFRECEILQQPAKNMQGGRLICRGYV